MSSPTQSDVLLSVDGFTKKFGRVSALSEVSFSVRRGEILGLIGPNGAGKTTLFECLAGVLPAESGTLYQGEHDIASSDRSSFLFYMPDGIAPWPAQSVRWALDFTVGFFGGSIAMRDDVIGYLGLEPMLNLSIGALSKGQRKRVLLAIGLLTPQPVLLADEPFDGLDLRQTREVARVLRTIAAAGRTLFLSIHQITDAAQVCDRFVLLSGGRVCGEGTLSELCSFAASQGATSAPADLEGVFLALT